MIARFSLFYYSLLVVRCCSLLSLSRFTVAGCVVVVQVSSIKAELDKYWPSYDGANDDFWSHEYEKVQSAHLH